MEKMERDWSEDKANERSFSLKLIWLLCLGAPTLVGFYLGTIWATKSDMDLQLGDIRFGAVTAGIGFCLGLLFALYVNSVYPKAVDSDIDEFADFHPHH